MKNRMNNFVREELQALNENIEQFTNTLPQNESLSALIGKLKEVRDTISQNTLPAKARDGLLMSLPLLYIQIRKLNLKQG
ncbi:MAG: hypothetical protein A2513_02750 [Sulfurimonas sp. RIFOXYD12_FULL_33_39]|uniref:hypothetical protein n=1 Tax=unclassified Sulfurimonas TaxID=2623549 RepID=UPI0008D02369|nr:MULTISPECIES: hypothetical protein [unclassified Sulfurimonas]OHE08920.1 MAG: hypothetical protein A2513_02750 [Sulfurimonas sp. RIFOXYD12_FULL_33_39]OHE14230.1 MAG: hypothetical protein A2530_06050 [Sulfurimonas sp. RIFOXYD2_FULL_34_21]DAB27993.1 MAG TPA: hypothetical protein CFH78_04830 [Sulfurimonas sp. UBA10385]